MEKTDGANDDKPTYFGSDHVLNSKLVSAPCKQFY